ncbi:hypothetical protein Taro_029061 [Colocasia esculenta]|uniref:Homeobox domain-containing protein n=1 Tax=Colocasia esculenta TaxID=4460 RepID=A0A843VQ04_COLES|nr:hypothetical protein [Colocasia esculenta]
MAAAAATSPSSMASGVIVSSQFGARRGNWSRVVSPSSVVAATSSSSGRSPSLRLRLSLPSRFQSLVTYARRRKNSSAASRIGTPKKEKKSEHADDLEEEDIDEDAFEALFNLLEEDLKNDNMSDDDMDDELTEEDLARLEQELTAALGDEDDDDDDFSGGVPSESSDLESMDDGEEDEEEYKLPRLKNWQLRRLASALKNGRRKTSIKNLSAELGLDRALVLDLLREPPPNLLLMAASLPDKVAETLSKADHEQGTPMESLPVQTDTAETESKEEEEEEMPVHIMTTRWSNNKRLKKVQVETLERVYARTKRPTNAMISSIVHVTNLPWKTVIKWFEDKRVQDGVPDHHRKPFRRPESETVFSG